MAALWCTLYMLIFAFSGIQMARLFFPDKRPVIRLWLGLVFGLVLLMWLPALLSFVLSFCLLSQLLAVSIVCLMGIICFVLGKKKTLKKSLWREELPLLYVLLPLMLIASLLLHSHIILKENGALFVGQSTYGDLSLHLGFITSIAEQGFFPPVYSICPGTSIGYPFLSSSLSASFYQLGCSLRYSVILPSLYAFLLVFSSSYFFFESWLRKKSTAVFACYLFFIGGGFGFAYFFDRLQFSPDTLGRLFTAFYETPTNFPALGLRWVNPIADMLIPQRATLFGWAVLFPCLYLLHQAAFEKQSQLFIPLGILGGSLPLIHTHSFLALGVISAFYFLVSLYSNQGKAQWFGYLRYLGAVLVVALPQLILFTFRQSESFLSFHWNWDNVSDHFLWFYIKNIGLLFLLMPVAFFMNEKQDRIVYGGALLLWALAEIVRFQPNPYDNNKLLFIWFLFTCGLVGKFLADAYRKFRLWRQDLSARIGVHLLSLIVCVCLFISGALTLSREYVSRYELIGAGEVAAAEFVKANTAKKATFLTYNNHNNAIAVLTGRNIVCGSGTFLYFHGVDYQSRERVLPLLFEQPALYFDHLGREYGIDYILIGSHERYHYACDTAYFDSHFRVVYEENGVTIYEVSQDPLKNDTPA